MPPKRRGAQAKPAPPAPKPDSGPPKPLPQPPTKSVFVQPPPPPPPPPESGATKVRREWTKFIDVWYEPQQKKLSEKLQKDLLVKYKHLGTAKQTQKQREMELFEKLDDIARQLAEPARAEWERRLALAQLREDQWNDMTAEEQHAVMSVFVGFADDIEDMDDVSAEPSSVEEEDSIIEEPPHRVTPSYPPAPPALSRQTIPPTPTRQTFEFVNPTSFFTDTITPPIPIKNLPSLSMDHLTTLGPSNTGRSAEPISASVSGTLGFQNWASEAGIVTQQPPSQPAKATPASTSGQTLSARPRATSITSRQPSAASTSASSSPPLKTSSPQYSPPDMTTKSSLPINAENLPLGKRYIGPVIQEEEADPMDEAILKSRMADEYQQYKISLRIQMIYEFHNEAIQLEIKLFETLNADEGTKESRARVVQEHETNMMRLREQKEEKRKGLCAKEREKRREEMRQHIAQRRPLQTREVDPAPKVPPPKQVPDKSSVQPRPNKVTHQKENVPLAQPAPAPSSSVLELPSLIKKSISNLSQDEASANEAIFASAMAAMRGETAPAPSVLTSAQASLNEALFSNAAATLAAHGQQPASSGKSTLQPPSIMKKSNSARSQEHDVPHVTVSFAEPPVAPAPEFAQAPPAAAKSKKGKRGQPVVQVAPTPAKGIAVAEEAQVDMSVEPAAAPSLWDAATSVANVAKNAWGAASGSLSESKAKFGLSAEEAREPEPVSVSSSSKGNANAKKTIAAAGKKGKKGVTIMEEPDVDADPIVSPTSSANKAPKGAWGSVNGKSKAAEESEVEPLTPIPPTPAPPPTTTPARGKKMAEAPTKAGPKPHLKVAVSEMPESKVEPNPAPASTSARTNKAKSAWEAPAATSSTSTQAGKKAAQQQQQSTSVPVPMSVPRHGVTSAGSRAVPGAPEIVMPGALGSAGAEDAEEDEEEGDASAWFNPENISYWANFMAGSPEAETQAAPRAPTTATVEQAGPHVRWTPTMNGESDDEDGFGDGDAELETNMWMQYAISGGDIPGLDGVPEEPPLRSTQREASVWEQGKGKKTTTHPTAGDVGNRTQQTSVFDRAALAGQWPKMENWLSPASRGQGSGSARVF